MKVVQIKRNLNAMAPGEERREERLGNTSGEEDAVLLMLPFNFFLFHSSD